MLDLWPRLVIYHVGGTEPSGIYFPLRSNARALVAGGPANAVRARLKLASLLYDRVLVEDGEWEAHGGPQGSVRQWDPPSDEPRRWQTASERRRGQESEFMFAMKPSQAPPEQPAAVVIQSPASIAWRATFEPIKNELPRTCEWFEFGHASDPQDRGFVLARMDREVSQDEDVKSLLPEPFVRDAVVQGVHRDLLVGAAYQSAVSVDALHGQVLRARIASGDVVPAFGPQALSILVPECRDLSWEDVAELRRHRSLGKYRSVLREVESAAWDESTSVAEFERTVHEEFQKRLLAISDAKSLPRRLRRAGINVAVGELTGLALTRVPGAGAGAGLVLAASQEIQGWSARRWVAAHQSMRRRSGS